MSKKRVGNRSVSNSNEGWKQNLITVSFDAKMRIEYETWSNAREIDFQTKVEEIVSDNWKISFSWSDYYGCYYGSITCRDDRHKLKNKTITVRHADFSKICSLIVYVIDVLIEHEHPSIVGGMTDELHW